MDDFLFSQVVDDFESGYTRGFRRQKTSRQIEKEPVPGSEYVAGWGILLSETDKALQIKIGGFILGLILNNRCIETIEWFPKSQIIEIERKCGNWIEFKCKYWLLEKKNFLSITPEDKE